VSHAELLWPRANFTPDERRQWWALACVHWQDIERVHYWLAGIGRDRDPINVSPHHAAEERRQCERTLAQHGWDLADVIEARAFAMTHTREGQPVQSAEQYLLTFVVKKQTGRKGSEPEQPIRLPPILRRAVREVADKLTVERKLAHVEAARRKLVDRANTRGDTAEAERLGEFYDRMADIVRGSASAAPIRDGEQAATTVVEAILS
jgi:hypothetical protein